MAATTQVRLLVWSNFLISAVLGLSQATKNLMSMTAQLWSPVRSADGPGPSPRLCTACATPYETRQCHAVRKVRIELAT